MSKLTCSLLLSMFVMGSIGCHDDESHDERGARSAAPKPLVEQVAPPLDVKKPPEDAKKTSSGLMYTKLMTNESGVQPTRRDKVLVRYTGWRQKTGDTFFTTKGHDQPITIDLATAAPGFAEALALMRKGEKAMMWIPSNPGTTETLVYEVEVVDVVAPPNVAARAAGENDAKGHKTEGAPAQKAEAVVSAPRAMPAASPK